MRDQLKHFLVVGLINRSYKPKQKNMIPLKHLIFTLTLITLVSSFSIQGTWLLQDGSPQPVALTIQDFVFRGDKILQKLSFMGCQQMLLQSQFSENQVFINPSSYRTQPVPGKSCQNIQNNPLNTIFSSLSRVFYFQINIDSLVLNDPYGAIVMKFKRQVNTQQVDLSGVWTMNQYASVRTSISVEITPREIVFCQGKAVYRYSFPPQTRNSIFLQRVKNTCPSQQLTKAVESVRYYRLNDGILDFYDTDIAIAVEMIFSKAYDPSKPTFKPFVLERPAPVAGNNQPTQVATRPIPPTKGISRSNLSGTWSIITLFDIPFPAVPYKLVFTLDTITLQGGCNTYTFPYQINATTQIITVDTPTSTEKACQNSDDGLFVSGVTKMYKYLISATSKGHSMNFYDTDGNIGYALEIRKKVVTKPVAPKKPQPFANGVVLLLLLQRRDLPRAVVKINGTSLSYTKCNTISHNFKIGDPHALEGNIEFTSGISTLKACPNSNDQVYIDALNSAVSYVFDPAAKTTIFKDTNGKEVVTFNRA